MRRHQSHSHHTHGPTRGTRLLAALGLTLTFAALEALGGWYAGSLALLGDAGHMLTDATALGVAALAAWIAQRPPSTRHSYGPGRIEVLAALGNALLMVGIVGGIVWTAVDRLHDPPPVAGGVVVGVALLGLVVNLLVAVILYRGEQTLNVRGALLHVVGDLLGSLAALISGIVIVTTGWTLIDPLLSLTICALILYASLSLFRPGLRILMEGVPPHLDLPEVGETMTTVPGVRSVHDLHIWTPAAGMTALSAHVVIENLNDWEEILNQTQRLLHDRFGIEHVTLQPEPFRQTLYPIPRSLVSRDSRSARG